MRLGISVAMLCGALLIGACANKDKQALTARERAKSEFEMQADPPMSADTHVAAGQLAESQSNFNVAMQQYQAALKIDPNNLGALLRIGRIQTQTRQFAEAVGTWKHYIEASGGTPEGYNNLAVCYELSGNFDYAEQTFKMGIARDPGNSGSRLNYARMLARRGRVDEASKQLQGIFTPAQAQYELGAVFEQQGQKDQAKAYYQNAVRLDPRMKEAQQRLAALE